MADTGLFAGGPMRELTPEEQAALDATLPSERDYPYRCPKCGQEEKFMLQVEGWETLTNLPDGNSVIEEDVDLTGWTHEGGAKCLAKDCGWKGTLGELEVAWEEDRNKTED